MKLIRALMIFPILCICFSLSGCSLIMDTRDDIRYHKPESFIREEIIKALDTQDAAALRNLFSNDTAAQVADLEQRIKEYVSFYKGTSLEYTSICGTSNGMSENSFDHWYTITTDEGAFVVYYSYISRDKEFEAKTREVMSDQIGLHSIVILTRELADEIIYNPWPPSDGVFIYTTIEDILA